MIRVQFECVLSIQIMQCENSDAACVCVCVSLLVHWCVNVFCVSERHGGETCYTNVTSLT